MRNSDIFEVEILVESCFSYWAVTQYVRFKVFTVVTVKNAVIWGITSCGSYKNRRFGECIQLLLTTKVVPSSLILFTLMMEAITLCEISVLTKSHMGLYSGRRHSS
jgi:hypothetical protein